MTREARASAASAPRVETIVFLQFMVLALSLLGLLHLRQFDLSDFDFGPSREALAREEELLALTDVAIEGLELVDVSSWPGRPTPWTSAAYGRREYRYSDDQGVACQRVVEELESRGVVFDSTEPVCAASRIDGEMSPSGRLNCGTYETEVRVAVVSTTYAWEELRSTVRVLLEAPHPGMGPGHKLPELVPVDCSKATDRTE